MPRWPRVEPNPFAGALAEPSPISLSEALAAAMKQAEREGDQATASALAGCAAALGDLRRAATDGMNRLPDDRPGEPSDARQLLDRILAL
jgi:hypothetical protein